MTPTDRHGTRRTRLLCGTRARERPYRHPVEVGTQPHPLTGVRTAVSRRNPDWSTGVSAPGMTARSIVFLTAAALAASTAAGAASTPDGTPASWRRVVLVELFTSQGCS